MKIAYAVVLLIMFIGVLLFACPKGSSEYRGECVVDITPEIEPAVKPLPDKPPHSGKASYEDKDIKIIDEPNLRESDWKADLEKAKADSDGKRAAGVPD